MAVPRQPAPRPGAGPAAHQQKGRPPAAGRPRPKGGKKPATQGVDLDATLISINKIKIIAGISIAVIAFAVFAVMSRRSEGPEAVARREVNEAQDLSTRAFSSPNMAEQRKSYDEGTALLAAARSSLTQKDWENAQSNALGAQARFRLVINQTEGHSDAAFFEVEGKVEVQRGADGAWVPARVKMPLNNGDFVKTGGNGNAEIRYADGQVHTIRPDTLFEVARRVDPATNQKQTQIKMKRGVVSVITTGDKSEIVTPSNTVVVQMPDTKGEVEIKADNSAGYSVFEGTGGSVSNPKGEKVEVKVRERVEQKADMAFAPKVALPDVPSLSKPMDNQTLDPRRTATISLVWLPVANASRYHLQISRSRFFVQPEVDVADRTRTDATVKILQEGSYFWRVAAMSREGVQGAWSMTRRFKLTSPTESTVRSDAGPGTPAGQTKPAPPLTCDDSAPIGNLWLLSGQTESGAVVTVNGETAAVDASGRWSFSYSFKKVGLNTIIIKATTGGAEAKLTREYTYYE